MERLQKVLAQAGIASRRKSEILISDGRVCVNGEVITEQGYKVKQKDVITVDGKLIQRENRVYYIMYKPKNCVSTMEDEHGRFCVKDLVESIPERIYPVGRLDYDTTGALILSNDGEFANMISHPSSHVYKVYELTAEGIILEDEIKMLRFGVDLDGVKTLPAKVQVIERNAQQNYTMLSIRIFEGKNRQVRRMLEAVGHPIRRLHRCKIGTVGIEGMKPGQIRILKPQEVKELRRIAYEEGKNETNS